MNHVRDTSTRPRGSKAFGKNYPNASADALVPTSRHVLRMDSNLSLPTHVVESKQYQANVSRVRSGLDPACMWAKIGWHIGSTLDVFSPSLLTENRIIPLKYCFEVCTKY